MTSRELFRSVVKGKNMMTPEVLRYGFIDKEESVAYELSEGGGIELGTTVVGVTFTDGQYDNQCFVGTRSEALKQAEDYIYSLIDFGG